MLKKLFNFNYIFLFLYLDPFCHILYCNNNYEQNVAIIVVGYNRTDYLTQVIKSLEKNPESQKLPFFFFIDGGINSKQDEIETIIKKSTINEKKIILRDKNYGCGKNLIDARRYIFDQLKFKVAIIFEDDLVVSPNYISLTLKLYNWCKNLKISGIVQCWHKCKLNLFEKKMHLNKIHEPIRQEFTENFWGYCIDYDTWQIIKGFLYEYETLFLNDEYSKRDNEAIRKWIYKKYQQNYNKKIETKSKLDYSLFLKDYYPTGQNAITLFALYINNLIHVTTVVNRAIYIGKEGIHYNAEIWRQFEHDKVNPDWFDEDKNITEFEFVN